MVKVVTLKVWTYTTHAISKSLDVDEQDQRFRSNQTRKSTV